ncbi:MAG: hypothetical protein JWN85_3150 [Gammaproteobacteria bacterium]|nr:hypothetical protein [Gammaproteobacteria bacterium]
MTPGRRTSWPLLCLGKAEPGVVSGQLVDGQQAQVATLGTAAQSD